MKKYIIIHPFLFALFPILFLVSHNIEQASLSEILLPSAFVLGITFLLILLSNLFAKDIKKVAVIISIFIILFFSYGHIYDLIVDWSVGSFEIGRHRYLLIIWGLILICSTYLTIRMRRDLQNLTSILNVVALSLIVISIFDIGVYHFQGRNTWTDRSENSKDLQNDTNNLKNISELPDIYYIILDGYASSSTLTEVYNFDNQDFNDYLSKKGFYIADKSRSNYSMTSLSLASSLNIEYINYLTDVMEEESIDLKIPYQMIQNSKVMRFLKSNGYKFIHSSSGWGPTHRNKYADVDFISGTIDEFLTVLIQSTLLKIFEIDIVINQLRETILNAFSDIAEVHKINGPKFVFAHIIAPHPPYLFDANGDKVPEAKIRWTGYSWDQKENYLNQLIFVNKKVKELVDKIIVNSEIAPIIIMQADHGADLTFDNGIITWNSQEIPQDHMLQERFRIFNAYYLPSGGNELLYESITPVNTFRLVFDFYFGTNYGLLEDKSYYSTYNRPFDFINVTDNVKYE